MHFPWTGRGFVYAELALHPPTVLGSHSQHGAECFT